jgi:hypothetical protein
MADGIPYCISHLNNFFAQDLTYITRICIKIKISLIPEKIRLAMSTHCSDIFSVYFSSSKTVGARDRFIALHFTCIPSIKRHRIWQCDQIWRNFAILGKKFPNVIETGQN